MLSSSIFAYKAPNGKKYVVVSFEDACDDKDYDDLMFALNPADVFDFSDETQIESNKTTVEGVTWVIEVTYSKGLTKGGTTIRPFLWRAGSKGQTEVHLPWVSPTNKADKSLFGTKADKSDPNVKKSNGQLMYYVGEGQFPFFSPSVTSSFLTL